ncbi:MAG: Gfo/Idh/MocA family oxidoreductase [Selenomonadaceae bacterium]|nr:Gfo/Idh/MocA family oxidoreductase [Selenomonadaceae bacterium]
MNVAVLGTGMIIPEAIGAMQASKKFRIANIWAREHSRNKAAALAEKFGVEKFTTNLDDIANDPAIDFVYVGLVNAVHHEYAKKFLDAGKNVIVEKPFTVTAAQAQDLIDTARSKKLFLFEAITTLHLPNFFAIRDALTKIGDVKIVLCNFSQYSSRYDAYKEKSVAPAFNPKLYGGALTDINIYNLNFVVGLFGLPKKISCAANFGWNGIDTSGVVSLEYENFLAQCVAAKDSGSPSFLSIQGDSGYILAHGTPNELNSFDLAIRGQDVQKFSLNKFDHRMIHEFVDFAEIFEHGDFATVERGLETSLNVMTVAERAAKSAGIIYG